MTDASWYQVAIGALLVGLVVGVIRIADRLDRIIRLLETDNERRD